MKSLPTLLALPLCVFSLGFGAQASPQDDPPDQQAQLEAEELELQAEERYVEGSFELARRLYEEMESVGVASERRGWVDFRLADCAWRAKAQTNFADATIFEQATAELKRLAASVDREEDRDLVWAEAHESLGDFHWDREGSQNWGAAWPHYQAALDYWAGSSDLDVARRKYLDIVFTAAQPEWSRRNGGRGVYANYLGVHYLENAVRVAVDRADVDRAHYLLGTFYCNYGQNDAYSGRAERELEAVLAAGRDGEWYDDALYQLAYYLENYGRPETNEHGQRIWKQDYRTAAKLYRTLLRQYDHGSTSYYHEAESRLKQLTEPSLFVFVDQFFLPDSEVVYRLNWRNVDRVELALYRADLTADVNFEGKSPGEWLDSIQTARLEAERRWTHETKDAGDHRPEVTALSLDEKLAPGAWVLEASAEGKRARALVLVSDAALTAKGTADELLAWFTDVRTGEPIADADLRLWQRYYSGGTNRWREREAKTLEDGTFVFELERSEGWAEYFLAAKHGERQAFVQDGLSSTPAYGDEWRIYATTDRSTYRPGNEVKWKFTARRYDGATYSTPAGSKIQWELIDPLGANAGKGEGDLNVFGSAWSELETTADMPLGEYRVQFYDNRNGSRHYVGEAPLFRLEEYKLPEFEVSVRVPDDAEGRPALFGLGDQIEFEIEGSYFFGGPVAGARVEVFVYQKPYYHTWSKDREFPWFYDESHAHHWWGGHGQQVAHQILKTDLAGRVEMAFDTPADAGQDYEYSIEARVVDSSRREVLGQGTVRVTRSEYFVRLEPRHAIHRPDADVAIDVTAVDANGTPVATEGTVTVTRDRWIEVWRDPEGKAIRGTELERLRREGNFPPPGYRLESRGYDQKVVETATVRTGPDGTAEWRFRPDQDGTYRIAWSSEDSRKTRVESVTTVFVADESTRDLGYLSGGIEILVDKDTLEVGQDAIVVLATPTSGRWVLFTAEADGLYHHEVVRMDGTAKLVRLPITQVHVPNVFLGAITVADGQAFQDQKQLIVPPTSQFLDVELALDRDAYLPGEEGHLEVTVRDHNGEPVAVELSMAVVDDALAYIQGDYAGDPRRFFYGQRRGLHVRTRGTVHHSSYRRMVRRDGEVVDEQSVFRFDDDELGRKEADGFGGMRKFENRARKAGLASNAPMESLEEVAFEGFDAKGRLGQAAGAPASQAAGEPGPEVRVRSDFRETALWVPDVSTDSEGTARVPVRFPDSTTRWRATVRAADTEARFGIGEDECKTRQPLIARLQAPRFFLVGDELILSGNLNNNTDDPLEVRVGLETEGLELLGRLDGGDLSQAEASVEVPAQGQRRVDWRVRVVEPGEATIRLTAIGAEYGDAIERRLPVHVHGIGALVAESGKLREGEVAFDLELPAERQPGTTHVTVQVTPSVAVTMLDALPYLIDYPYGCTEQTLSRFVPTVVVAKTLRDLGLSPGEALERSFGGIEEGHVSKTHPDGEKNLAELDRMVARGLERLYDFQHSDGGWAWWKTGDSDRFMTAYVLWGLSLARDAGVEVRPGVLENGARWLARELVDAEYELDLQAWMLHALAVYGGETGDSKSPQWMQRAFENLFEGRSNLNAYGRALFAIAAKEMGRDAEAEILIANLVNGVNLDERPDTSIFRSGNPGAKPFVMPTAHWGEDGIFHRWSEGGVEATAFALRALVAVDPEHELVEPTLNWLVRNRRGAQWSNTRDTAISVLALNDYLIASGELGSDIGFEVLVNGMRVASQELSKDELLRAPSVFKIENRWIRDGKNEILIRKTAGEAPLYFAAHARFFSQEEPIPPRGNHLFARRDYYKLVGRETLLEGLVYDRVPLNDGDTVTSGERIEVVLTVEAKNNLEYLLFEDLKPAGFEAVQVRSGEPLVARQLESGEAEERFSGEEAARRRRGAYRRSQDRRLDHGGYTGQTRAVHQELRDRKVALFVDKMKDGIWELRYDLRAEVPGRFHALPVVGHAMYVPEIRCNGRELRLEVLEASAE